MTNTSEDTAPPPPPVSQGEPKLARTVRLLQLPVWFLTLAIALSSAIFGYNSWDTATKNLEFQKANRRPAIQIRDATIAGRQQPDEAVVNFHISNTGSTALRALSGWIMGANRTGTSIKLHAKFEENNGLNVESGSWLRAPLANFPIAEFLIVCSTYTDLEGHPFHDEYYFQVPQKYWQGTNPLSGPTRADYLLLRDMKVCDRPVT